ncbi:MAG TPA: bifunctional rhamnulose-1-phosphate aldolase/short-chain dehydrogenase [Candidatus Binatus sp.]|uniref:bifunctional rhamnulose-1-phosphate aldolase/short-chain dehydrogenase n=1 Tax=Candidatus Binatus sp. TaxID=2811406 RepID=UPI002F410DE5
MISDRWNDAAAKALSEPALLLYRSHLLGADLGVTNFGGGNTSAKIADVDPLNGARVTILWVKGSGDDLGSMDLSGFAKLYQDKIVALESRFRGREHEDELVPYFDYCAFAGSARSASVDTPLHAFLPFAHVDHVHPDSVIAIAAARRSGALTRDAFGGDLGWLPWQRPGFDLGLRLRDAVRASPKIRGVVLAGHGLITWGDTSKACYQNTIATIRRAEAWLSERIGTTPAFGGERGAARPAENRSAIASQLMPALRGRLSVAQRKVGHFADNPQVLEFVASQRFEELANLGTSCPDHFLRTKIRPLVLPADPAVAKATAAETIARYRSDYQAYYERCRRPDSPPMRDANPVVILMPSVGMFTFAKDKATARIASEFYCNAIGVMRGASEVDEYLGLPEQEAFDIEYWALEEAKLRRQPAPKPLAGRVAIVTGGAGGIGGAIAQRLLADDACVVLLDNDEAALERAGADFALKFGNDRTRITRCDVTDEASVARAFAFAAQEYGGVDVVVSNAGIASAAPFDQTTLETWRRNMDVLGTGYFLIGREAARVMKAQGIGGSIVFVASKNGLVASAGAAAYSTAKAAELHLARCMALELAPDGIRVNAVNPDAVLQGSRIWSSSWRAERARAYEIDPSELEKFYRERSLLKQNVTPEDVAEAVHFFASDRSAKSTGNILNVDAGNAAAFTR